MSLRSHALPPYISVFSTKRLRMRLPAPLPSSQRLLHEVHSPQFESVQSTGQNSISEHWCLSTVKTLPPSVGHFLPLFFGWVLTTRERVL